jgi:hypothetical protein
MYLPDEQSDAQRSPYLRSCRMYAPTDNTKRVAISKRPGHAVYTIPVGEALSTQQVSVTGAADQAMTTGNWIGMPFVAGSTGQLSRVDLNVKNNNNGTGPLIVAIYSDNAGIPGTLLATSSIPQSSMTNAYQYLTARFIEAPSLTNGSTYWIVTYIQADGSGDYKWSSTTTVTTAKTSVGGTSWNVTTYGMDFKTYIATTGSVKGLTRFYRSTTTPLTLFAFNTDVYSVNDGTGVATSLLSGLDATADFFDWANVNNKVYWCNGINAPRVYDGTTVANAGGSPPSNASQAEVHANRLFWMQPNTNFVSFSDAGSYESIGATSFLYIPAPNTADPAHSMISFQGNLVFFTRNSKFVLYGTDLSSFILRESPTKRGAVGAKAVAKDANYIYFMDNDGLIWRYNGATDEALHSERVWPITKNVANNSSFKMYVANRKLFISYRTIGRTTNNHRLVYDLVYQEWLNDEEVYSDMGITLGSQTDTGQVVVGSSQVGALLYSETGTNDMGKPITFEYRTKYFSFGNPAAKHRVKRFYTFLRAQTTNHTVDCQVDADEANSPVHNYISVNAGGSKWGTAVWGSFTWGVLTFLRNRISVGGAAYKHQFRYYQSGVDNQVDLLGHELYVLPMAAH